MRMGGRFVVIEGLDGSGGTTQARLLGQALPDALLTCEPTDGPVGRLIREVLAGRQAIADGVLPYLFAADRADHLARTVLPALEAGRLVVSDRYLHSSLAYQSLAVPLEQVERLNAAFPAPDLTVFLDLDPEACMVRIAARSPHRDRFETLEQLRAVGAAYELVLERRTALGESILRLDGGLGPEALHRLVLEAVRCP